MKKLILFRHAKSSWKDSAIPDHQRPLNKRGKKDAPRMGEYLQDQGVYLDVILCSTAKRARATAKGFLKEYTFEGDLFYIDDLYQARNDTFITLLKQLPENVDTAMIIGHNPEMEIFLEIICDEYEHMPTASMANIRFLIERWIELSVITSGELMNLWVPREI